MLFFPYITFALKDVDTNEAQSFDDKTAEQKMDHYNVIEGLGPFKIGKTTPSIIKDLEKKLRTRCVYIKTLRQKADIGDKVKIGRLLQGAANIPCKRIEKYILNKFALIGLEIYQIELTFFDHILIEISAYEFPEALQSAFSIKYGPPTKETKEETESKECTYLLTGIIPKDLKIIHEYSQDSIQTSFISGYSYNKVCRKIAYRVLIILDKKGIGESALCTDEKPILNRFDDL
jgi:hypothetical protein